MYSQHRLNSSFKLLESNLRVSPVTMYRAAAALRDRNPFLEMQINMMLLGYMHAGAIH